MDQLRNFLSNPFSEEDPTSRITEGWNDPTESVKSEDPQNSITKSYTRSSTKSSKKPSVSQTIFSAKTPVTAASTSTGSQTSKTSSTSEPSKTSMRSSASPQAVTVSPSSAKMSSESTGTSSDISITSTETASLSDPTQQTETISTNERTTSREVSISPTMPSSSSSTTKGIEGVTELTMRPISSGENNQFTGPTEYLPITDVVMVEEESFNELGKEDMISNQEYYRDDRFMDNLSLKASLTNTKDVLQTDSDRPSTYDRQRPGDMEIMSSPVNFILSAEEFRIYKAAGYFNGVKYSWKLRNGSYVVTLEPESYKRFYDNKGMLQNETFR